MGEVDSRLVCPSMKIGSLAAERHDIRHAWDRRIRLPPIRRVLGCVPFAMGTVNIGGLDIAGRALLAPMAGVTDLAFRVVVRRFGCGLVASEMVSAAGLHQGGRGSRALLATTPEEAPLAVQLFGSDPARMAEGARKVVEAGAALVDVNMGCPVLKVVRTGAGIALMRDERRAAAIVSAIREAVDVPVTVKIRTGPDARTRNAASFARAMVDAGAQAVTVHARPGGTRYAVPADWSAIAEVVRAVTVPVIGNGDVMAGDDARRMLAETGAAAVMVGRGALGRPWVFREIAAALEGREAVPVTRDERRAVVLEHLRLLRAHKPERVAAREFRKHLGWYSRGLAGGAQFRARVNAIESCDEMAGAIEAFLGRAGNEGTEP
jgi:tRNA-dihydrouridine synthase B